MFENKPSDITQELLIKKQQLDTLLEMVQMLNQKVVVESPEQLIRIFELSLRAYFGVEKVCFILKQEQNWTCPILYGFDKSKADIQPFFNTKIDFRAIQQFLYAESMITLSNATENDAVIFISQKDIPSFLKESNLTFVKTMFNVLLSKLALKKLIEQQIEQETLQRELKVAGKIQNNILPKHLPKSSVLTITAFSQPYIQVGGDFYDVIQRSENEYYIVIADVSGKGVSAAIMMANLQASLRALISTNASLSNIVKNLNKLILELANHERFLTLFLAKLDIQKKELYYINCGHPYPVLKVGHKIKLLNKGSTILGSFAEIKIQSGREKLNEPSCLVLYTDGISEAMNENHELYDTERIMHIVHGYTYDKGADVLKEAILSDWADFQKDNKPTDDATLLICTMNL